VNKEDVILFGASTLGVKAYKNLKSIYKVVFFSDNDSKKWNTFIDDIKIISPEELKQYKNIKVLITSMYVKEISQQLVSLGISNYEIFKPYTEVTTKFKKINLENYCYNNIHKNYENLNAESNIKKVLFVQNVPDIRTYKIAKGLSHKHILVDVAYLYKHPNEVYKDLSLPYNKAIKINDLNEFITYVDQSDYDIVHSSNEPDFLTTLLLASNKPIIHDCHDMSSLYGEIFDNDIIHEFVSNKLSDGNIYVDYPIMNVATEKFGIKDKSIFLLNNYILEEQLPKEYKPKLSELDGEIHCVYEGGLSSNHTNFRYLEDKFKLIANEKIHVHYYTIYDDPYFKKLENMNSYLHWEGTVSPDKVITEMTKYDIGLVLLNVNNTNREFLSTTFPNKAWEYLGAGIPIITENLPILNKFISDMNVGTVIFNEKNIKECILNAKSMIIEENFLKINKLLMDDFADYLIRFYSEVKRNK
jgi:hypothetical protein